MSLPWLAAVKNTHQLRIFATQAVRDGPWGPVFTRSLQEFNRISQAMKLGVMFVPSARPPDISTMTEGANVQFDVGEGTVQADTYKNWRGEVLHSFKRDFSGRECHGLTMPIATEGSEGIRLRRKYIYVPTAPEFNSAFDGHVNMRVVGNGV